MLKDLIRDIKATMGIYETGPVYGIVAEFPNPGALLHAAEAVRKAGYRRFDVHSPFPIHGMDKAMGLGQSKVGFITLGGGLTGFALGYWMQWWMGGVDYPLNIGGKPFFAIEPSIPIMFELTVLFSAFGAVIGMLALNGLPRPYNPLFYSENFSRFSDDAFFLHIAASDRKFDRDQTVQLLRNLGGTNLEIIRDAGTAVDDEEVVESVA